MPETPSTTAEQAYRDALDFTLEIEGGYYAGNEARDPNPTNFGVIQKTYDAWRDGKKLPRRPVKLIERHEVEAIYRGYWVGAACEHCGPLTAATVFDMSINAGPGTAVRILQRALGVDADGRVGPKTRAVLAAADDVALANAVCWERVRYYVDLAKTPRLRPNLLSWMHRVVRLREQFLRREHA